MTGSPHGSRPRRLGSLAVVALLLLGGLVSVGRLASPALAESNTALADVSGELTLQAPGKWRSEPTEGAIKASGFLQNYRAEIMAVIYPDVGDADAAALTWKAWRKKKGDEPRISSWKKDRRRWIARSSKGDLTEYARAVPGVGKTAVVWLRIGRAPGEVDDDAFALLDTATLKLEKPSGDGSGGGDGEAGVKMPESSLFKDLEHRIEIELPPGFYANRDVKADSRRVISVTGPVGDDPEAFVDVYSFADFSRADAAGWWWHSRETRGWGGRVVVEGEPPSFRVLPEGETWNRLVKLVPTSAGLFGVKIDVEAGDEQAAVNLLALFEEGKAVNVLKTLPSVPVVPQGFQRMESEFFDGLVEGKPESGRAVLDVALGVDKTVEELLGLAPWNGRKGLLRVYASQETYDVAVRLAGGEAGTVSYWSPGAGMVFAHVGSVKGRGNREKAVFDMAREAIHRRFGYRPPFWIEYGVAHVVASGVANHGRFDKRYEVMAEPARDAASGSVEFEALRWWRTEDAAGHAGREAVAWSFAFFFTERSAGAKRWSEPFHAYLEVLRETARPGLASKSFDFSEDPAVVAAWKNRMSKL